MKKTILILTTSVFMSGLVLTSCDNTDNTAKVENSQEKVADAQEDLAKANEDYSEDVEAYKRDIYARIDANERLIDELKEKKKYEKGETKEAFKARIEKLKDRNRELRKKLDDYKQTDKGNWEKFKEEFNHDMDEFGQSFKDIGTDNVK